MFGGGSETLADEGQAGLVSVRGLRALERADVVGVAVPRNPNVPVSFCINEGVKLGCLHFAKYLGGTEYL